MFQLDQASSIPVYEQIVRRVKELCLRGVFKPGAKLPSVRELAVLVIANPNTVSKAYQELERQGVIESRPGKGTFVAEVQPERWADPRRQAMVKHQFETAVMDAILAGIEKVELLSWVEGQFRQLGGDGSTNSRRRTNRRESDSGATTDSRTNGEATDAGAPPRGKESEHA